MKALCTKTTIEDPVILISSPFSLVVCPSFTFKERNEFYSITITDGGSATLLFTCRFLFNIVLRSQFPSATRIRNHWKNVILFFLLEEFYTTKKEHVFLFQCLYF